MNVVEKFRKLADGLTRTIEDKRRPMTQNPTPKRMREYRSRLHDADNLERTQRALLALADAHAEGTIPPELAGLRTKDEIYRLVYKGTLGGGYYDVIPSSEYSNKTPEGRLLQKLLELYNPQTSEQKEEQERLSKIKLLEANVQFSNIPGYFPTPKPLAQRMVELAGISASMRVLEPSAGKGDIAEVVREAHPTAVLEVAELYNPLQEILRFKRFNIVADDFLGHAGTYERIVMNPPFEGGQDIDHVAHAWTLLKPGGRLVAIMSAGVTFRTDKKSISFRGLVDRYGEVEPLPPNSFKVSGTSANTVMVTLERGGE